MKLITLLLLLPIIKMKRLFINNSMDGATILDDRKQPYHIPHNTNLALKSCSFKIDYPSSFKTILKSNTDWTITFSKQGDVKAQMVDRITFKAGSYTLKKLADHIDDNSLKMSLTILTNGNVKLSILDGYRILSSNDDFWKVLGIGVASGVWYGPGNFFGRPQLKDPSRLNLIWNELDGDNYNFLDGKPSKIMHSFPLLDRQKLIDEYYEHPVFLPITSSTTKLSFRFDSDPEVKVSDIFLELLIK